MINFVHMHKAIGIFLEKSCEPYMLVLEKGKDTKGGVIDRVPDQFYFG